MKKLLKQFIPPIVFAIKNKILNPKIIQEKQNVENELKIYKKYSDALNDCEVSAYQSNDLVSVVFKKTKIYQKELQLAEYVDFAPTTINSLTSVLFANLSKKTEIINIIDFGGTCGVHYYQIRKCLDKNIKLNYCVVETSAMVDKAKSISNDELTFTNNLENAIKKYDNSIDLLHTSGTLQYTDKPYKYLENIFKCNAKYILFNRMSMTTGDYDVISVQSSMLSHNGIGKLPNGFTDRIVKYPHTNIRKNIFDKMLKEKYEIVYYFNETSGIHHVNNEPIIGFGLLCKLRDK